MRQFDVYENPSQTSGPYAPYLVVVQSHLLQNIGSVVLAPLIRDSRRPVTTIDLPILFADENLVLAVSELASVKQMILKSPSAI